ncbi:hypothetical protein ACFLSV_06785 [Bacteroidota bacterium]
MQGKLLINIPIYYRSLENHAAAMRKKKDRYVNDMLKITIGIPKEKYEKEFDRLECLPWEYSQIVGYVELRTDNSRNIKAYYWYVKAKRLSDTLKNRTMKYAGKLIDVSNLSKSNNEIKKDIRKFISSLPELRKKRFKDHYFDTRIFDRLFNAIDFSKIE